LILLLSIHALAILGIVLLPLFVLTKGTIILILLSMLAYYLRRYVWLLSASSYVAIWLDKGDIILTTRDGQKLTGTILRDSFVTPALIILNVLMQDSKKVRSVLVFSDSLDHERSRELRVLLRWGKDIIR